MYILGLSCFAHDAAAALIKDGEPVAVVQEERLSRVKHTWRFPEASIRQCLAMAGIAMRDVDAVAYFWKPWRELIGNAAFVARNLPASLNLLRGASGADELTLASRIWAMARLGRRVARAFGASPPVRYVEHHLCHAASAFDVSGFDEAAILTIDGRGESSCTLLAQGDGNGIVKLVEHPVPHSIGHLYTAVTSFLGHKPFFDEWKVMGMSAYGKGTYEQAFSDLVHIGPDGGYRLNLDYFDFPTHGQNRWVSREFVERFGPPRAPGSDYDQRHFDLAFALQRLTEGLGLHLAGHLHRLTGSPNLCLAGGVALNVLMNMRIVEEGPFRRVFIQPIATDAGTALGAALHLYHQQMGRPRDYVMEHVYLGPEYDDAEIEAALSGRGLRWRKTPDICAETAAHIAGGKIVGWFQGRMEAGPRALGNRSITVDPRDAAMKDRLNLRVKKREFFRPFAPSVLEERCQDFFEMPGGATSPYMILAGRTKAGKEGVIPAVTHADGTARVHTVSQKTNPRYWQLIREFEKITGVPVILNTSFNENEPIVCTPVHAVECFLRTDFDVLAIGDYLAIKS